MNHSNRNQGQGNYGQGRQHSRGERNGGYDEDFGGVSGSPYGQGQPHADRGNRGSLGSQDDFPDRGDQWSQGAERGRGWSQDRGDEQRMGQSPFGGGGYGAGGSDFGGGARHGGSRRNTGFGGYGGTQYADRPWDDSSGGSQFGSSQQFGDSQGFGGSQGYGSSQGFGSGSRGFGSQEPRGSQGFGSQGYGGQPYGNERMSYGFGQQSASTEWQRQGANRKGPKGYTRSDDRIKEDVCDRLMHSWELDIEDVSIEVKDGTVTIEGTVPEREMKHRIENVASMCMGVKDVENRVRIAQRGNEDSESASSQRGGAGGASRAKREQH